MAVCHGNTAFKKLVKPIILTFRAGRVGVSKG